MDGCISGDCLKIFLGGRRGGCAASHIGCDESMDADRERGDIQLCDAIDHGGWLTDRDSITGESDRARKRLVIG